MKNSLVIWLILALFVLPIIAIIVFYLYSLIFHPREFFTYLGLYIVSGLVVAFGYWFISRLSGNSRISTFINKIFNNLFGFQFHALIICLFCLIVVLAGFLHEGEWNASLSLVLVIGIIAGFCIYFLRSKGEESEEDEEAYRIRAENLKERHKLFQNIDSNRLKQYDPIENSFGYNEKSSISIGHKFLDLARESPKDFLLVLKKHNAKDIMLRDMTNALKELGSKRIIKKPDDLIKALNELDIEKNDDIK